MNFIIPGTPPPMKPGEVDEWRNWILAASARMVDETRIRMRRQDHIEVIGHGVTVMRDEIVRLAAERDAFAAWQCATCGAQFRTGVLASMLDGVTQCSQCVMVEVLTARCGALGHERDAALARAERLQRVVEAAGELEDAESEAVAEHVIDPNNDASEVRCYLRVKAARETLRAALRALETQP